MRTEFTPADAQFLASLERDLPVLIAEVEKYLADMAYVVEKLITPIVGEQLLHIDLDVFL